MLYVQQRVHCEVNKLISDFLWSGKSPKISKDCLELPTSSGGLGLHCFRHRVAAAKIAWVKRASMGPSEPWHSYLEFRSDKLPHQVFLERHLPARVRSSPFFSDIVKSWKIIYKGEPSTDLAVRNESLWGNHYLRGKVKKKWRIWCQDRGINLVKDILYMDHLIDRDHFKTRFGVYPPSGLLQKFDSLLPVGWMESLFPIDHNPPEGALYIQGQEDRHINIHFLSTKGIYLLFRIQERFAKVLC